SRGWRSKGDGGRILGAHGASVDWVEAWNARLMGGDGNARAAELAVGAGVAGVAGSGAPTPLEIRVAYTPLRGDPSSAEGLRAALEAGPELVMGRASAYIRLMTPMAKAIH